MFFLPLLLSVVEEGCCAGPIGTVLSRLSRAKEQFPPRSWPRRPGTSRNSPKTDLPAASPTGFHLPNHGFRDQLVCNAMEFLFVRPRHLDPGRERHESNAIPGQISPDADTQSGQCEREDPYLTHRHSRSAPNQETNSEPSRRNQMANAKGKSEN